MTAGIRLVAMEIVAGDGRGEVWSVGTLGCEDNEGSDFSFCFLLQPAGLKQSRDL